MIRLTPEQIARKVQFFHHYCDAENAATGSILDANANVSSKNIATFSSEEGKGEKIQLNRALIWDIIDKKYGRDLANQYLADLETHLIYTHDETSLMPYCASISIYPYLLDGLRPLGGLSKAPTHLESFCGSFPNLIFTVSSQFAGAVATVEFLMAFDHFARIQLGDDYLKTNRKYIMQKLQGVVYTLNEPAGARGFQCVRADTTQVMTPEGFKYRHELNEGDEIYVWVDGVIKVEVIRKLNDYDYDGELNQFRGRNYQQTVTPNHRVVYKKPNTNEYAIKESHELIGHSKLSLPIGSLGTDNVEYGISDTMLKVIVAVLTDGSIENVVDGDNYSGRIRIYKSKNRYGFEEIPEWLNELGIGYSVNDCTGNKFGDMVYFTINNVDAVSILRRVKQTKKSIPHFFKMLSKRQLAIVIDTWAKFDGNSSSGTKYLLQCDSDEIRDQMQELVMLAGYGSEIYDRQMKKIDSDEPCTVKYVKVFNRSDKRVSSYEKVYYKGKIWCPTTNAGVVIFREENGVPYVSGNSCFWNISTFDEHFFNGMFGTFVFPDGGAPKWETFNELQKLWHTFFREEREESLLTFPVVTHNALTTEPAPSETAEWKSQEWFDFCAEEFSKGGQFFIYTSDTVDSLSSCCRLRNAITDNTFSFSLGAGGVMTGSKNVITINMNRLVQENHILEDVVRRVQKYQTAFEDHYRYLFNKNMLPVYKAGFVALEKQYLTIGINGLMESAEYMGLTPGYNPEYIEYCAKQLGTIKNLNLEAKSLYGGLWNTEFVPAESLGVKNASWDKADNLWVPRDCYNSYMYPVEGELDTFEKMRIHGHATLQYLDGGSAYHDNEDELLTVEQNKTIFRALARTGCNYYGQNVLRTECGDCGHIHPNRKDSCVKCGSDSVRHATRIIGYLKFIDSYSKHRKIEHAKRSYKTRLGFAKGYTK